MLSLNVLTDIFGAEFVPAFQRITESASSQESSSSKGTNEQSWMSENTSALSSTNPQQKNWVLLKLDALSQVLTQMIDVSVEENKIQGSTDTQNGRVGPKIVKFDIDAHAGSFIVSSDRLGVSSQCNFGSVRANVCVFNGRWQFEVQLGSKGVMQLGFSTIDTKFSSEKGVGDTKDSYSYDGNRVRKWNDLTAPYGDAWQSGDIIGCCIDLDGGQISYYRNGKSMGIAFSDIFRGSGIAYFPAASLSFNENIVANFGASPFQFPVIGFLPFQCQKFVEDSKTQLLLTWLDRLLNLYPKLRLSETVTSPASISSHLNLEESLTLVLSAQRIFELLVPNIHSAYVVENRVLPFFARKLGLPEQLNHREKLIIPTLNFQKTSPLLDLFWTFLEETEMQNLLERLCIILINFFRSNALCVHYPFQHYSLQCFNALAAHRKTRRHLIRHLLFDKTKLTNFLHVRPYDDEVLKEIIPTPWWEGKQTSSPKLLNDYNEAYGLIQENVKHLEIVQIQLLKILMTNTDGTEKRPSSRSIFLKKLRLHLRETMRPGSVIQHTISRAMCAFFRLLKLVETLWTEEVVEVEGTQLPDLPSRLFYDTSINYFEIERLGGLANYLYKSLHEEVSTALNVPDYLDNNTQATDSYSDTPMPSFFALSGISNIGGGGSHSAPAIVITAVRNNRGPGDHPTNSRTHATSTEVQTSNSLSARSPVVSVDGTSTRSAIVGLFHGPQTSPNTESQTENVPERRSTRSATSSGEISTTTMGGHAGTALLAGTPSGHNILIPMFTDFRSALAHDPRMAILPGGFFSFPNFEGRQGPRPNVSAIHEQSGRDKGVMNVRLSLRELLDDIIILYNCGVGPHVEKVTALRTSIDEYVKCLNKANLRLKEKRVGPEEKAEIAKSIEIFTKKLEDQSRFMAWVKGSIYTIERQQSIVALLKILLATLRRASNEGPLFGFVPEIHLTTLIQLNWLLLIEMEPILPPNNTIGMESLFRDIAEFIATHFTDSRIVIAETKDALTQALSMFICNRTMLTALEEISETSQLVMMKNILRPYENRAWAQSNWMLVRIWQGSGFAFQYPNSAQTRKLIRAKPVQDELGISATLPPTPSPILQTHVSRILIGSQKFATNYIHSVLNQLNWAFSEFIGLLQEIQTAANRPERVFIESRQLKICCTCYELTLSLLRVLEMVLNLAPQVVTDFSRESAESLLGRLCMLVSQVLNRIGSGSGSFAQVLELSITGLESITYFPILSAVSGIIVTLLQNDLRKVNVADVAVTKTLLREPSFQLSSLDFLLGQNPNPAFSLRSHVPADLSEVEIQRLYTTISHLQFWSPRVEPDGESVSDDDICTICYAYKKSTTFKPCNHRACRTCIIHHLMNRGDCFFCKRLIEKVIADDGTIVHDITPSEQESTEVSETENHVVELEQRPMPDSA